MTPLTTPNNHPLQMVRRLAKALEGRVDVHEVMVDRICVDRLVRAEAIEVGKGDGAGRDCLCVWGRTGEGRDGGVIVCVGGEDRRETGA